MSDLSRCKILIVDDAEENIDILVETLGNDYAISVAMDGESALEIVADIKPDLILLDIMMPGMDGYEVCRRLKSARETENIPVVFVTAMGEIEDEQQGLELGAVDYIIKPISPPIVQARVKSHIALKEARDHLEKLVEERTRELHQKMKELEGRDSLVRFQMQSPDIKAASREILRVIAEVIEAESLCLFFPEKSIDSLKIVAFHDEFPGVTSQADSMKSSSALQLASRAFHEKRVLSSADDNLIASPIVYQDEVLGVILLRSLASETESRDEIANTLWRMANEAAMVLRMARFTEDIQKNQVDFDALLDMAEQNL